MGFNDVGLRFGLGLSLGLNDQRESKGKKEDDPSKCNKAYPSLTLGPSDHSDDHEPNNNQLASKVEASSRSTAVSSFSNSCSIKRERDHFLGEEFEVEVEKVPSKVRDDVDEDGYPRKKLRLTKEQSAVLEENFKEHSTLNPGGFLLPIKFLCHFPQKQKQELARKLNMRARQVEVWFQNRRARTKLKQTESDCEVLKKYCETLTEENKKLQKELQELKSLQTTLTPGPYGMQIPAATTLIICPSCESGNSNGSPPTTPLLIGSKAYHHFYANNYPFSNSSSAAC